MELEKKLALPDSDNVAIHVSTIRQIYTQFNEGSDALASVGTDASEYEKLNRWRFKPL